VADYGRYTLTVGAVLMLQGILGSLLGRTTVRFLGRAEDPDPVATAALRLHLGLGVLLGAGVFTAAPLLAAFLDEPSLTPLFRVFALSLPVEAAANAHVHILVGLGRYRRRALSRAAFWVARPLLVVGPVLAGYGVPGALLGALAAPLASLAVARGAVRPRLLGPSIRLGPLLSFGLPLFVAGTSTMILRQVDLLALKALGGDLTQAGLYGAAQNLAWIPTLASAAVSPILLSSVTRALGGPRPEEGRRLTEDFLRGALWLLPVAGATAGAAGSIAAFAYGGEFRDAGPFLAVLIFAGVSATLGTTLSAALVARGHLRTVAYSGVASLAVAIVAFPLLIPGYGGVGAAVATASGAFTGIAIRFFALRSLWQLTVPWGTLLRVSLATPLLAFAATLGPTGGPGLVLKLTGCLLLAVLLAGVTGEFRLANLRALRRSVPRRDGR
jgi:PST family polysaccharide transporter